MSEKKDKIAEILKIGIATEINGERFYRGFASKVTREETRKKIQNLGDDEIIHKQVLEKIYEDIFNSKPSNIPPKGIGIFEKALKGTRISDDISVPDLLDIAIEAEAASRDYYDEGEKSTEDESVKAVFRRLAEEEDGHFNLLTAEKTALAGLDWFAAGSSGQFEH
ncbi:MAG: hypothetical protein GF315_12725 [candidate division Zixibacteria bacterium]|nr:hypothetical protein [candidate division Zixibacteria bacterium]